MGMAKATGGILVPKANPGISWSWLINVLVAIIGPLLNIITPKLREELAKLLTTFYVKAKSTDNPWDDFLAEFLLRALGYPVPPA